LQCKTCTAKDAKNGAKEFATGDQSRLSSPATAFGLLAPMALLRNIPLDITEWIVKSGCGILTYPCDSVTAQ